LAVGLAASGSFGCQASVQGEAKVGTSGSDEEIADFDRPLEAPPIQADADPGEFSVAEYALLGARHDLSYAGSAEPVCHCLAVSLQDQATHQSLRWQLATPRLEPTTQWVIAFTSNDVECQSPPAGTLGASYQGYEVCGDDVVVYVEALGEGRPMTSGAVIPKPHPGGSVFVEPAGSIYGKPLKGRGKRCRITPPGQ
jgi:hypothetical protein